MRPLENKMDINNLLIKRLKFSKKEARIAIQDQRIFVNNSAAIQKQNISEKDKITVDGKLIEELLEYKYYAFYKPRGIECTLNPNIKNNLLTIFPFEKHLFPVGRLDKESEGLLLLTNDGSLYREIATNNRFKEKEYEVEVNAYLTDDAIHQLASGIVIMGQKTREAAVTRINENVFRIVLTQGLNRQIRRMCYKLNYDVVSLKRIRITSVELGILNPGEVKLIAREAIQL